MSIDREPTSVLALILGARRYPLLLGLTVVVSAYSLPARAGLIRTETARQWFLGLYTVNTVFFAGASAGAILIALLLAALQNERLRPLARIAQLVAITSLIVAAIFIAFDVVRPSRLSQFARSLELAPPDAAEMMAFALYVSNAMALSFIATRWRFVRALRRPSRGARPSLAPLVELAVSPVSPAEARMLKAAALAVVPAALLLDSVQLWTVRLTDVEPGWHTVLTAALLYGSCTIPALALIVTGLAPSSARARLRVHPHVVKRTVEVLAMLIPVLGYCFFAEIFTMIQTGEPEGRHLFREITIGPYAPAFWFELVGGIFVPFFMLVLPGRLTGLRIGTAAGLVVLTALLERWTVVVPAVLGHAHSLYGGGGQALAPPEISLTVAAYTIGLGVYCAQARSTLYIGGGEGSTGHNP